MNSVSAAETTLALVVSPMAETTAAKTETTGLVVFALETITPPPPAPPGRVAYSAIWNGWNAKWNEAVNYDAGVKVSRFCLRSLW